MCNKKLFLFLFLSFISFTAIYGQKTKTDSIQEQEFGKIRAEMVRETCNKFGYKNKNVINKITQKSIFTFYQKLEKDTADNPKSKWLYLAVGNLSATNGYVQGKNVENDEKSLENYLSQIQRSCSGHKNEGVDTLDGPKYRKKIKDLAEECSCYRKCEQINDYKEYKQKYPRGLFNTLIVKTNDSDCSKNEETPAVTTNKVIDSEKQQDVETDSNKVNGNVQKKEGKGGDSLWQVLLVVVLGTVMGGTIVVGGVAAYRHFREKKQQTNGMNKSTDNQKQETQPKRSNEQEFDKSPIFDQKKTNPETDSTLTPTNTISSKKDTIWAVVGASVKGNGHIQTGMPCQDCHKYESIGKGWGIAIVSDGAGSAKHSEIGSKVVVERGVIHFKKLVEKEGWMQSNTLPTDIEWWQKSYDVLKTLRNDVAMVAQKNNVEIRDLSATCLVVIYSPVGLLAAHVGDGRMGYENMSGEWKPMMTPHKGEEANQTIFLVSDFWSIPNFTLSGVLVPESVVVRDPVKSFALMSDGCENTAWLCTAKNEETGRYYDRNLPFVGFFNPLRETVLSQVKDNIPESERNERWHAFIESGTDGFVKEQDDKTMVYGVNFCVEKNV